MEHPSDFGKAWGAKGIQWARQPSGETTEASLQISLPIVGSLTLVAELPELQGVEKSNQQLKGAKPGVERTHV